MKEHQAKHQKEVVERWGDTDAYKQSMRRARGYSRQDWERIKAEQEAVEADMAALLAAGADPAGEEAMAVAERHRRHIHDNFYACSYGMHAGLADMYEADPRFAAHYEERAEGLCAFTVAAIRANAMRAWDGGAPGVMELAPPAPRGACQRPIGRHNVALPWPGPALAGAGSPGRTLPEPHGADRNNRRPRLRGALVAACEHVQRHRAELNRINVFPVPDGDTGPTWR